MIRRPAARRYWIVAACGLLSLVNARPAQSQAPWAVALTAAPTTLAIGGCSTIYIDLKDASGKEWPRNARGWRVSMADFDLTAAGPTPSSVVGNYSGATSFSACACQSATVGSEALVTATYPAASIAKGSAVDGVRFKSIIKIPITTQRNKVEPQGCNAALTTTVAAGAAATTTATTATTTTTTSPAPGGVVPSGGMRAPAGATIVPAPVSADVPVAAPVSTGASVATPIGTPAAIPTETATPAPASAVVMPLAPEVAVMAPTMPQPPAESMVLTGWVDLHAHPMVNLAFSGKLIHGGVDVGSLLPADTACAKGTRATSPVHALGSDRPSTGGWDAFSFPCGDEFRKMFVGVFQTANEALVTPAFARGYPNFEAWPAWNDLTHQKMWYEWIRRARDGGQRVMVALATNNKTLADAVAGPGDGPTDDMASGDLQIAEMKAFVARHPDFMEVARSSADVKRIAQSNRIAVVLGVEIDNIGNFNKMPMTTLPPAAVQVMIANEIQRLYANGVRYIFPVHVMDNLFGGTAIYKDDFNTANLREAGHFWSIECADVSDNITHKYVETSDVMRDVGAFVKLGLDPLRKSGPGPVCPLPGQTGKSFGHRNALGLTAYGAFAVKEMMKRGMLVDIDHMSQKSADATLAIAESFDYPVLSGHSGIRGWAGADAENSRTPVQLARISKLHGMFGMGSDGVHSSQWSRNYQQAVIDMGYHTMDPAKATYRSGAVAFGTDLNGLVKGPRPGGGARVVYDPSFPMSKTGTRSWNYNTEGVAHYGMLADFVRDVRTMPSNGYTGANGIPLGVAGPQLVDEHLNRSANYFWHMWEQIEARKSAVH